MLIKNIDEFLEIAQNNTIVEKGHEYMISDGKLLNKKARELEAKGIEYSYFTLVYTEENHMCILNGIRRVNKVAHIIITLSNIKVPENGLLY